MDSVDGRSSLETEIHKDPLSNYNYQRLMSDPIKKRGQAGDLTRSSALKRHLKIIGIYKSFLAMLSKL